MSFLKSRRSHLFLFIVPLLALGLPTAAPAAPGDPDGSFGNRGSTQPKLGNSSGQISYDTVIQDDGKILMVGRTSSSGSAILARYLPHGALDHEFADGGHIQVEGVNFDSVVLDPDGRIVAAGHDGDRAVVARFLTDGTLDTSFGTAGLYSTRFDLSDPYSSDTLPERPRMNGVAALADGSVFAAGKGNGCTDDYGCEFVLMLRLDSGGNPVPIRGQADGNDAFPDQWVTAVDVLPKGNLVLATRSQGGDPGYYSYDQSAVSFYEPPAADGSLPRRWRARFNSERFAPISGGHAVPTLDGGFLLASGSVIFKGLSNGPDPGFGRKGLAGFGAHLFSISSRDLDMQASDVAVDNDGNLVVAGLITRQRETRSAFVARLNPQVVADPTFSNNGLVTVFYWAGLDGSGLIHPRISSIGDRNLLTGTTRRRSGDLRFALRAFEGGRAPGARCGGREATWIGTSGPDKVTVDSGVIATGGGEDEIRITSFDRKTIVCSGAGDDEIRLFGGEARGGPGDDEITGRMFRDKRTRKFVPSIEEVHGGKGNDVMNGLAGNDRIFGDQGGDAILGGDGDDDLFGGPGQDDLNGEAGNDHVFGGSGEDVVAGGPSNRPHTYYRGTLGANRARFTQVGDRIVKAKIFTAYHCSGDWYSQSWNSIRKPMSVQPNGKFTYYDSSPYWVEKLEARIRGKMISGRYMRTSDDYWDTCWTGKKNGLNPWIEFRASFRETRRQRVRT